MKTLFNYQYVASTLEGGKAVQRVNSQSLQLGKQGKNSATPASSLQSWNKAHSFPSATKASTMDNRANTCHTELEVEIRHGWGNRRAWAASPNKWVQDPERGRSCEVEQARIPTSNESFRRDGEHSHAHPPSRHQHGALQKHHPLHRQQMPLVELQPVLAVPHELGWAVRQRHRGGDWKIRI